MKRTKLKRQYGIALPIAIVVIFVMIALILVLVMQSRNAGTLQQKEEKNLEQTETANLIKGKMQDIFCSPGNPPADKLKEIGLSSQPPAPGQGTAEFKGKVGETEFNGCFNGGTGPWSTFNPIPQNIDPKTFGYSGPASPSFDPAKLPVPPNHSLLFVNVKAGELPASTFYYMFSNNSPYGLVAPRGDIVLHNSSARATTSPKPSAGADKELTQNFYVQAGKKVVIDGKLTGTARTSLNASEKPVTLGDDKSGVVEEEVPPIPPEELEQLMAMMQQIEEEMAKNSKDPGFEALALGVGAAAALFQGYGMIDLGGFSFDGKSLVWNNSLIIPKGYGILMPLPLKIKGDLLMMDKTLAVFKGDLKVEGRVFLGEESGVLVLGNLDVKNRVNVTFSADDYMGINAALISTKNMTLHQGVRHLKFKPFSGETGFNFNLMPCPFPDKIKVGDHKIDNPVAIAFKKMQQKLFAPLKKLMGPLAMFAGGPISVPVGNEDMDLPGLLIVSEKGTVKIKDNAPDAGLAGLIITKTGLILEFPPDGTGVFTGICICYDGTIEMFNVVYRYYPYFAGAAVPINGGGESRTVMVLPQAHLVSSGVYKK